MFVFVLFVMRRIRANATLYKCVGGANTASAATGAASGGGYILHLMLDCTTAQLQLIQGPPAGLIVVLKVNCSLFVWYLYGVCCVIILVCRELLIILVPIRSFSDNVTIKNEDICVRQHH